MAHHIVTLDSAGARLIALRDNAPHLVEQFDHPEGRMHDAELNSDRPGRGFDRKGGSHTLDPEQSPRARKVADFVRQVCARLEHGRNANEITSLSIAAGPQLLGLVRATLDKNTSALVSHWVSKDLQHVALRDLDSHLERQ